MKNSKRQHPNFVRSPLPPSDRPEEPSAEDQAAAMPVKKALFHMEHSEEAHGLDGTDLRGWERVPFSEVTLMTDESTPVGERWRWHKKVEGERSRLQIVKPDGSIWDFKLGRGAYLRKAEWGAELAEYTR